MAFSKSVTEKALINSRRCCCVCNDFADLYVNVHHIKPRAKKGPDTLGNAIVLCLKCHGEVGHYNSEHPIGKKYSREELVAYRDNWWNWCKNNPYSPLPKSPVIISPNEITLRSGGWSTISEIDLFNKTDVFIYQIWLKIIIRSDSIKPNNIKLTVETESKEGRLNIGDIDIYQQMFRVTALDDNNNEILYLVIEKLKPKTNYSISLSIDSHLEAKDGDKLILFISSFSGLPSDKKIKKDRTSDKTAAAVSITPPERLQLQSISMIMKQGRKS
jgi:hypothetical protein